MTCISIGLIPLLVYQKYKNLLPLKRFGHSYVYKVMWPDIWLIINMNFDNCITLWERLVFGMPGGASTVTTPPPWTENIP